MTIVSKEKSARHRHAGKYFIKNLEYVLTNHDTNDIIESR